MRLIPGKTKVEVELFKGVSLGDLVIGGIAVALLVLIFTSMIPGKVYIAVGLVILVAGLLVRLDEEPNYMYLLHVLRHFSYRRSFRKKRSDRDMLPAQEIGDDDTSSESAQEEQQTESREAAKQRRIAEKKERKADDKILKSKSATKEEKDAIWLKRAKQSAERKRRRAARNGKKNLNRSFNIERITAFTDISDGRINYDGKYYATVIEIPPVEFRFFSASRRANTIENGVGRVLRSVPMEYSINIVKLERPVIYDNYIDGEYKRLDELRTAYEQGALSEDEFKNRAEVLFERINDLREISFTTKVVQSYFYIVLFDSDRQQLENNTFTAMETLRSGEINPRRLNDKELAVFLKYSNSIDFDEREIEKIDPKDYAAWAMPQSVKVKQRTVEVNNVITHNLRIVNYPTAVDDAWLASVMSFPSTKVVIKCTPMDRAKSVRGIDRSLQELRAQWASTGVDSKRLELQEHIETLESLLATLKSDNETLMEVNAFITLYDIALTNDTPSIVPPPESSLTRINNMKRVVKKTYQEFNLRLNNMEFDQLNGFIGAQVSAWDPLRGKGRGIPSNTIAAGYPWVFANVSDASGFKLGSESGIPVFIDFFRRDNERVNSNMVIVGKSGSGKSYAAKSLLTNLAADDAKIFILDPENEYVDLVNNLHGKYINVANSQYGRLNPFHIITALDDDEAGGENSNSYATHMQFLEEFFRQVLPDCDKDALEYLSSLVNQTYASKGITSETDLSKLSPEDYPIFDDLYDAILTEFQATNNDYLITILRTLLNYVGKFSTGGRYSSIWNGPSSITTDENFIVFNFQSMLANRNTTTANAQMLLVLKYIDNEIIKNRDYNIRHNLNRKIVVVIDEAHVFIDTKFPVALDFMFQLAKRIRKYNGMQIVITQNIKDFVGSEEIARKSTAIINACQYSFIFSLSPNDMDDLCRLYAKAGGINEQEQEQIVQAQRGQAFTIMSSTSRSSFKIGIPEDVAAMFQERPYTSRFFNGEDGENAWEDFLGESKQKHENVMEARAAAMANKAKDDDDVDLVISEIDTEEYEAIRGLRPSEALAARTENQGGFARNSSLPAQQFSTAASSESSDSSELRKMLTVMSHMVENVNKFNYDAVIREVQRMIADNNGQIVSSIAAETANAAEMRAVQPVQYVQSAQPVQYVQPTQPAETVEQPSDALTEESTENELLDDLFKLTSQGVDYDVDAEYFSKEATEEAEEAEEATEKAASEPENLSETEAESEDAAYDYDKLFVEEEPTYDLRDYENTAETEEANEAVSELLSEVGGEDASQLDMMEKHDEITIMISLEDLAFHLAKHKAQ